MNTWKSLSIRYKIFISLLLTLAIGQIFVMFYIWQYETKILTQKEYKNLTFSLENESKKLQKLLQLKQKETEFLASLEIMDDIIAKDVDKRISNMLKRKADDLKEDIIIQAITHRKITASSHIKDIGKIFQQKSDYLYFKATTKASFDEKKILGDIILLYPYKNLTNLGTTENKLLWLTPLSSPKVNKKDYLIVSKKLQGSLQKQTLYLAHKKSDAFETIHHLQKMLFYTFLFSLVLLSFIIWFVSKNLLQGVEKLSKISKEIVKTKDYTKQVIVDGNDEIAELSSSFNTLITQTDNSLKELEKQSTYHLNNLLELINFFNTITQTKDANTTKKVAKQRAELFKNQDKRFLNATTHMLELQLERISLLDKTKEALEAKTMFLSTISHELRTPLASILNLTQHLMVNQALKDEDITILTKIENSATHLLSLINNILEISKLESNSLIAEKRDINIVEVLEEIIDMIKPLIDEKELQLIKNIPTTKQIHKTDPQLFKQVTINLLSNAIKYTHYGSITLKLEKNSLTISDTGIGIEPTLLPHIFEEFYQSNIDIKNLTNSSGLGLAISKKIAHLLGGDVAITSEGKGKGTKVIFSF